METCPTSLPDYYLWSQVETWTLKEAAFLSHNRDPLDYHGVKFNLRNVPNEPVLREIYKTFFLLHNVTKSGQSYYSDHSGIPLKIIYAIIEQKEIPFPKELKCLLDQRFQKQAAQQQTLLMQQPLNKPVLTRERQNGLKRTAIMTHIFMDCEHPVYEFNLNGRPNAHNIRQAMLDKADKLRVSQEGLKSSHRKIADALEFLEEEFDH